MLNPVYQALLRIQTKFSENNTLKEAIDLIKKDSKIDLTIHLEANTPISLCWDARSDAFTGSQSLTLFPKLVINGELYEAPFKHDFKLPVTGFAGLEAAFMSALKQSLGGVQRVWS